MASKSEEQVERPNNFDKLFKDRYTLNNERYELINHGFEKVVVVHPWNPKQNFDRNRYKKQSGRGWQRGNRNRGYDNYNSQREHHRNQWRDNKERSWNEEGREHRLERE